MAIVTHEITDRSAIYQADCMDVLRQLPSESIHLSLYSPPFGGLYQYSSDIEDLSNCLDLDEFLEHYAFIIEEISRVTWPGRISAVHCADIPRGNSGCDPMLDLPGEIIRLHTMRGFEYAGRFHIWKEPLTVRNRTMMKSLAHKTLIEDSTRCSIANADYLLIFRRNGHNPIPVTHQHGLLRYAGERPIPVELLKYRNWPGDQIENRYSQWIWRQYASSFWDDIRLDRVLPHREAKADGDEKHCLAAGSLVLTRTGYRPIETVSVGDEVLTHLGRWKPVLANRMNGVRDVVQVKAQGVPNLRLTPDHLLWCRIGTGPGRWDSGPCSTFHPRKWAAQNVPQWIQAGETKSHYLNLPLPPIEDSPLSASDWWIIGRWLGDGHMDGRGYPVISCSITEAPTLIATLGWRAGHTRRTNRSTMSVALRDAGSGRHRTTTAFTHVLRACGRRADGKQLPIEALTLEPTKAEALLAGYLSADGHFVHRYQRWTASSVSRSLLLGMAILAQRSRKVVTSVYQGRRPGVKKIEGLTCHTLQDWILSIPPQNLSGMMLDDGSWKKVRAIHAVGCAEVWDLEVQDDHSYVAEGCVVHNCHPLQLDVIERCLALYTNPGETVLDPFVGVGSVAYAAIVNNRRAVGIELKSSYYHQAIKNLSMAQGDKLGEIDQLELLDDDLHFLRTSQDKYDSDGELRS